MTEPPKPLFDRLPAIHPKATAKPSVLNVGREEDARRRLKARMVPIADAELRAPGVDPRTVAVSALMVANFVADEQVRKRFAKFIDAELLDSNALDDLPVAARLVLRILQKLGHDLDQRTTEVPPSLLAEARALRDRLIRIVERSLADLDDASGQLVTVRLGEGAADTVYDLRMLAALCRDHAETLAAEAAAYSPDLERDARATAQRLEDALIGPYGDEEREWRTYLRRAVAMLVPLYEAVCRAGRYLFHDEKPEAHFPTLASVARVRRRLKREATRRGEGSSIPPPKLGSSHPPGGSIPPEVSLVSVSAERERELAGALEAAPLPSPAAVAAVAVVAPPPSAAPSAPAPLVAPAASAAPAAPTASGRVDALEVVTLDFGSVPAVPAAPAVPGLDLDSPDLELDLTFTSESNFYTDVVGSVLGLFIATFVVVPVGTPLVVRLSVPAFDQPFIVGGLVQRVLEFSPSIEAPPGIFLALQAIPGAARSAIDSFMKVRTPILHED